MKVLWRFWWMLPVAALLSFCRYGTATYSIFISQSELERYYEGTAAEAALRGFSVDIIRDGVSLVNEDGSLVLLPSNETPPAPSGTTTVEPVATTTTSMPLLSPVTPELSTTAFPIVVVPTESAILEPPTTVSSMPVLAESPSSTEVSTDISTMFTATTTDSPQVSTSSQFIPQVSSSAEASTSSIPALSSTEVLFEPLSTSPTSAMPTSFSSFVDVQTTDNSGTPIITTAIPDAATSTPDSTVAPTDISATVTAPPASTDVPVASVTDMGQGSGMGIEIGSGMESPDSGSSRRRRSALAPFPSTLPPLPSHVDEVTFSWVADSKVTYELSLSASPVGHFSSVMLNINGSGDIPLTQSDFSIEFPCSPAASGVGVVTINLTTTVLPATNTDLVPDDILTTNFNIRKHCNIASSLLPTSTLNSVDTTPTSLFISTTLTTPTAVLSPTPSSMPTSSEGPIMTAPPGGSPAESQFVTLLLLVFAPVVGVLVLSIFIVCCSVCICCCCCGKKKRSHYSDDPADLPMNALSRGDNFLYPVPLDDVVVKKDEVPISLWMALSWGDVDSLPSGMKGVVKTYSVDRRSLSILGTLSRGDFGCIVNGQLSVDQTDPVSGIKGVMMKLYIGFQKQHGHRDEISKFLECATLLRGSDHPNVHSPLRVSVEDNYVPIVIYPIMEYGNLYQFLTLCRVTPADSPLSPVTVGHKVNFALQIACGMQHLSDQGIVHPDLALRNCYLHTNYQLKVSDGALSQCFYPECYNTVRGTVRPVRWAAIETLQEGLCTSQSNIWSYGVTVWEILTLAKLPYCMELDHDRGVVTHLLMDNRLSQPDQCPDNLYSLMLDCWKKRAEDRPNFSTLLAMLSDIQSQYPMLQPSPSTTAAGAAVTGGGDTNFSTFGKDLRPQISVTEVPTGFPNQRRRRSMRLSRNNSTVSQRNAGTAAAYQLDTPSQDGVSLSFSVLSDENFLNQGSESEDDLEGTEINIPMFLTGNSEEDLANFPPPQQQPAAATATIKHSPSPPPPRQEYPTDFSTFVLPKSSSSDRGDSVAGASAIHSLHPSTRRRPSQPTIRAPEISPLVSRSQCVTPVPAAGSEASANSRPLSDSLRPGIAGLKTLGQNDVDSISKASTLDSVATSVQSGPGQLPHSVTPTPSMPSTTYNGGSTNIGDVKLRNKSFLSANGQAGVNPVSGTPSGASNSDSGIRSDDEVDLMLSNGCPPPPAAPAGPPLGSRLSSRLSGGGGGDGGGGRESLGLGDLMSKFALWDEK